ncbi:MAG: hypothetical protein KKH98_15040 [Spirochaetes bacterium]|nr:hypothetical protein [Spirochaetota bacterium]
MAKTGVRKSIVNPFQVLEVIRLKSITGRNREVIKNPYPVKNKYFNIIEP